MYSNDPRNHIHLSGSPSFVPNNLSISRSEMLVRYFVVSQLSLLVVHHLPRAMMQAYTRLNEVFVVRGSSDSMRVPIMKSRVTQVYR